MNKLTIEEVETFITHNAHTFGATKAVQLAKQLVDSMRENERLRRTLKNCSDIMAQNGLCNEAYEIDVLLKDQQHKDMEIKSTQFMPQQFNDALQGKSTKT